MDAVNAMKLLVLCTGNSCRSQMAEGFLKSFATELKIEIEVFSAGVQTDGLNPRAVIVMSEVGIDISKQTSDLVEKYLDTGITHLFSVCDHAKESCPVFPQSVNQIHHSFPDPAHAIGNEEEILNVFRSTRDLIEKFCRQLLLNLSKSQE